MSKNWPSVWGGGRPWEPEAQVVDGVHASSTLRLEEELDLRDLHLSRVNPTWKASGL